MAAIGVEGVAAVVEGVVDDEPMVVHESEGQVRAPLRGPHCLCATVAHINTLDIVQIRHRPSMSRITRPMGQARISSFIEFQISSFPWQ